MGWGGGQFPSSKRKPKAYKFQCLKKSILDERGGERYPVCQREGRGGGGLSECSLDSTTSLTFHGFS